ncbi:glycosyltransferase [Halorubrum ezzemoulense]|uniref:Glycosyltransferase n=1 Tax=Halorubrum ezzemoulense TaxID=337243 RepID=A0A481RIP4_HALEZ|nr:glycosyltransferase [Halorubrum ezzemoulense]QAY21073.1 glycosyltransferase [Halorubrum ezzemoulense]
MKKIAIIAPKDSETNGIGSYTRDLSESIERNSEHTKEKILTEIVHLPHKSKNPLRYIRAVFQSYQTGDIVHIQHEYGLFGTGAVYMIPFFLSLLIAKKIFTIPIVITIHEGLNPDLVSGHLQEIKKYYILFLNGMIVASSDEIIFLSTQSRDRFQVRSGSVDSQIIPHGSPISQTYNMSKEIARKKLGIDTESTLIVQPGYISKQKGNHLLIEIAEELPEYNFMIAGGTSTSSTPYSEYLRENAPSNLEITGHLPEERFHAAFIAGDIAVLPYKTVEMSGIVNRVNQSGIFNWCAAYTLPVVASDCESFCSINEDWDCIELAKEGDPSDFSKKIKSLIKSDQHQDYLRERLRQYRDNHSFRSVASKHDILYRQL